MGCYKPLIRFYVPDNPEASGRVYTFRRFALEKAKNPNLKYEDVIYRPDCMLIPCGQCIGCKIDKKEEWATRIEMEAALWPKESIWFVTLTYDDINIPSINHQTGEVYRGGTYTGHTGDLKSNQTLWYEDIQSFLKRLRKASKTPMRFFCAGEYGTQTGRPHYHLILFNYYPEKLEPYRLLSKPGYFTDTRITKAWPYGIHNMSMPLNDKAYKYTAAYVTKKMGDEIETYKKNGLLPPFCQMSRKPGLGDEYYKQHYDEIWQKGYIQLSSGKRAKIPRYFQEKLRAENPRALWEFKKKLQEKAISATKERMGSTDVMFEEYMKNKELSVKKKLRSTGSI